MKFFLEFDNCLINKNHISHLYYSEDGYWTSPLVYRGWFNNKYNAQKFISRNRFVIYCKGINFNKQEYFDTEKECKKRLNIIKIRLNEDIKI